MALPQIIINFEVGIDPDVAAVNVQNRVTTVLDELPEEVIKAGVTTEKEVNSMLMFLNIMSSDTSLDEKFIYNFTDINVLQELKRINGVGRVEIMGSSDYAMRVWLKPDRMAGLQYIHGRTDCRHPQPEHRSRARAKPAKAQTRHRRCSNMYCDIPVNFIEPEQYGNIIVRANSDGSVLHLKDVADMRIWFAAITTWYPKPMDVRRLPS